MDGHYDRSQSMGMARHFAWVKMLIDKRNPLVRGQQYNDGSMGECKPQ